MDTPPKLWLTRRAASLKMKANAGSQGSSTDSTPVTAETKKSNWEVIEHFASDCSTHSPNLIAVRLIPFIGTETINLFQIGVTRGQSIREEEEAESAAIGSDSDLDCGRATFLSRSNTIRETSSRIRKPPKDVLVAHRGSAGVESILLVQKSNNHWTLKRMLRRLCNSHGFKNLQVRFYDF